MLIGKKNIGNLKINNQIIEKVKQTTNKGTIINEDWDISQEIKTQIAKAQQPQQQGRINIYIKISHGGRLTLTQHSLK